jgi:hypothetical protein
LDGNHKLDRHRPDTKRLRQVALLSGQKQVLQQVIFLSIAYCLSMFCPAARDEAAQSGACT